MIAGVPLLIILVVFAALFFDFTNGWNDSANAIATVVSTRVLSPFAAVVLAGALNFVGAYLSTRIAETIGGEIVDTKLVTQPMVFAAMLSAAAWVTFCTRAGLPISGSHSLIGGLVGAVWGVAGLEAIHVGGLEKILVGLIVSPIIGLVVGFVLMGILLALFATKPQWLLNRWFGRLQLISVSFMALSHGVNDAQKVMGVITLALVAAGYQTTLDVPFWVVSSCALMMGLGTMTGGWKVIRTLGMGLAELKPIHGFAAETAASGVLLAAASIGLPVSTTHVITASIMGVGATKRLSAVRWGVGRKILYAWILTLPACALLGAATSTLLNRIGVV